MHALMFVGMGSAMLILLYFFFSYLEIALTICILISAFSSITILLNEYLYNKLKRSFLAVEYDVPYIGKICGINIISGIISISIIISYAITKNYILSNIIALFIVFLMFKIVKIPNLKVASLLLILAFVYDIFWVFYSSHIFGKSVMSVVATNVDLPMKL